MQEDQIKAINNKLDALIKVAELSGVFYSQSSEQLQAIINLLEENC